MHAWLTTYDRNLPLLDVITDPETDSLAVEMAVLSLETGLDSGFYETEALADAVSLLWTEAVAGIESEDSEGRQTMAELMTNASSYTQSLYDCVGPLPLAAAAMLLHAHARRMRDRADMMQFVAGVTTC